MNAHGGAEVYYHAFLNFALNKDEWPPSHPCRFVPECLLNESAGITEPV
jgi:hypothetical protein